MANTAKDDGGFYNTHAVGITGMNARSVANNTIHVFDTSTLNTLDVMVIVFNTRFIPCTGRIRQANATDQTRPGQVLHDQVDSLNGACRQSGTHRLKDSLGIGMRMMMQKIQNRDALRGGAQPSGSQGLHPVVGV